ncbi:L-threonylcarbamoyladenylate synthase [Thiohalocapsa sp. ML1]|jgi:L-threonylcarbamoyladenylate synthase|uniref:L-threonylcarbamoyladenylate synthase n=1 Tax=Thiohalocapsa sp. ML1 TaxID=1431688 RepID=UPI0007322150|nr:Sua5/YciO/YrdC/YwlC family protein [Thiohalocapsa sp. ML1]
MRTVGTSPFGLREAARVVAGGGVIAYPTEAVFGLGCDPLDPDAVLRILEIKRRDMDKGLILIAADFGALLPYVEPLPVERMAEIRSSWPGPNTWLLPARPETPQWLTGKHDTLAVRVTGHPAAAALCRAAARYGSHIGAGALVSTSANLSDLPAARTALDVRRQLRDAPDLLVAGRCGAHPKPSTIRDGRSGRVLRG